MGDTSSYSAFAVEGAGSTFIHPIGACMLALCGAALLFLPRRYALWGFLALICFVSTRQAIAIAGFNLYFPRIMVLVFGVLRVLLRGEWHNFRWKRLDHLVLIFGMWYFMAGAINWNFSAAEMKMRSGYTTELIGTYFLCRILLWNVEDVKTVILGAAIVSIPLLGFFLVENTTGHNLFSVFGGVPKMTHMRDGRMRCQGAFGHPILAGVFWATMMPLMIAGVLERWKRRFWYGFGVVMAACIVLLTTSSTPLLGLATAIVGWFAYPLRRYSRHAFVGLGVLTFVLHLAMKAPVWSLIQRINLTSGNSGYHRYIVVDGFITHAHEWWWLGSRVGTRHWGHFTFDTANQFVSVGVSAGFLALALFVGIMVSAMRASARIEMVSSHLGWGVGVSLFTLVVCFFGISIWGQMHFAWALPLAMAGSLGFEPLSIDSSVVPEQRAGRSAATQVEQSLHK